MWNVNSRGWKKAGWGQLEVRAVGGLLHNQRNVDDVVLHAEPENDMPEVPPAAGKGHGENTNSRVCSLRESGQFRLRKKKTWLKLKYVEIQVQPTRSSSCYIVICFYATIGILDLRRPIHSHDPMTP